MAKEAVNVATVNSKDKFISDHTEEIFSVKISQITHPLCINDAHPHGKNTKFWLIQKQTQQDRGSKRETVRSGRIETEQ